MEDANAVMQAAQDVQIHLQTARYLMIALAILSVLVLTGEDRGRG